MSAMCLNASDEMCTACTVMSRKDFFY